VVVAGIVAGAIAIASRGGDRQEGGRGRTEGWRNLGPPTEAGVAPLVAIPADASREAGVSTVDAAVVPVTHPAAVRTNPDVARHLAAAETAGREHRWLVELAEADAVLRIDPHNVRALLLAADAELGSGDLSHGCKYLHELGRNATARTRAEQAGCPGD
jgi:hypothetical protein